MASYGRQLYIAVRASDQASRPIRRIARDIASMQGRRQRLDVNRAQQSIVLQRMRAQMVTMALERESLVNGRRALAQTKAEQAAQIALANNLIRQRNTRNQINQTNTRILENDRRMADLAFKRQRVEALINRARSGRGGARFDERAQDPLSRQAGLVHSLDQITRAEQIAAARGKELIEVRRIEKQQVNVLKDTYRKLEIEYQRTVAAGAELKVKADQLQASMIRQAEAIGLAESRLASYDREIANSRLNSIANTAHDLSRALATAGLVGTASMGIMAKQAADFNTQLQLAATQSTTINRNTRQQVQTNAKFFQEQVSNLLASGKAVANPEDYSSSLYEIFSSVTLPGGQQKQLQEGVKLLKQFNDVAKANYGIVDLNEVTKAGIVIMNDFDTTLKDMPRDLNTMQAAVRFGQMNMSEFVSTFNNAAPAAKAAGYSFQEMAESIAFLSRQFPSVRVAAAGYARLTEILARPQFVDAMKAQGVAVTDLNGRLLPMNELIFNIIKKYPELQKGGIALQNFFKSTAGTAGTIQARRSFTFYVQKAQQFHDLSLQIRGDGDELAKSIKAMADAPGVKWAEFVNQFRAFVLILGTQAIPAFVTLTRPLVSALRWFNSLDESTKKLIATTVTFGSAALLLLAPIVALAGGVLRLIMLFRLWKLASVAVEGRAAAGGLSLLGAEAGAAAPQVAILLGAVSALALALDALDGKGHRTLTFLANLVKGGLGDKNARNTVDDQIFNARKRLHAWLPSGLKWIAAASPEEKQVMEERKKALLEDERGRRAADFMNRNARNFPLPYWLRINKFGRVGEGQDRFDPQHNRAAYDNMIKQERLVKTAARGITPLQSINARIPSIITKLTTLRKAMEASPTNFQAILKYNKYLSQLRTELKDFPEIYNSILQAADGYFSTQTKGTKDAMTAAQKRADFESQALQTLQQKYQQFYDNNKQQLGELFSGRWMQGPMFQTMVQFGLHDQFGRATPRPDDALKDIRSQVQQFEYFRNSLKNLVGRGLPQELVNQLQAQGPEGQPNIDAIRRMSDKQLKEYARLWARGQRDILQATKIDFQPEIKRWRVHGQEIAKAIAAGINDENWQIFRNLKRSILADLRRGSGAAPGLPTNVGVAPTPTKVEDHTHYHLPDSVGGTYGDAKLLAQLRHLTWSQRNKHR